MPITNQRLQDRSLYSHPLINTTPFLVGDSHAGASRNFPGDTYSAIHAPDTNIFKEIGMSLRVNMNPNTKSKQYIISKGNNLSLYTLNGRTYLRYANGEYSVHCDMNNTRRQIAISIASGGTIDAYCDGSLSATTTLPYDTDLRPIGGDIILGAEDDERAYDPNYDYGYGY